MIEVSLSIIFFVSLFPSLIFATSILTKFGGKNEVVVGHDFMDAFNHFDASIWNVDEDHLHCISDEKGELVIKRCIARQRENVYIHQVNKQYSQLQIVFRNDCEGHICCVGRKCTPFTGGLIVSKERYTYGSFRFVARITPPSGSQQCSLTIACVKDYIEKE